MDSLTATPDTAPADDVTVVAVSALIPLSSGTALRQIVFNTTAGVFTASGTNTVTIAPTADTLALVLLRAPPRAATAIVSASAGDTVLSKVVPFTTAQPDTLLLEPSAFVLSLHTATEVMITAILRRKVGYVSRGVLVGFSAPVGEFGATTVSNDSGVVHVRYAPGLVTDTLAITIKATVANNDTTYATGQTVLTVTP